MYSMNSSTLHLEITFCLHLGVDEHLPNENSFLMFFEAFINTVPTICQASKLLIDITVYYTLYTCCTTTKRVQYHFTFQLA